MNVNHQLLALLNELEAELKLQTLWSKQQPTQAQLSSKVPFAADVMSFEQWLEFIFIVRFRQMIEHNMPLPNAVVISPMAEVAYGDKYPALLAILRKIDALFEG